MEIGSAFVSILPSARGFGSKLNSQVGGDLDSSGKTLGSRFGSALKFGAGAVLAGGFVAAGFLKGALDEAREAQQVGAQTAAVIKSTGGVANVTAGQVNKLAGSISAKTGIDDEAIASASNLLLTFTNVRNEVGKGNDIFNQATRIATDMGAALGGDPRSSAIQLGKALNDPIKGISALSRVGVAFTEQQKATITSLVEGGDTVKAQKIILGELNKEFGGSAAAAATAGDKFKVAFGNLQESVGTALLPIVDKLLGGLTKFVVFLTNDIGPGLAALNGYLAPAIASVGRFFSALSGGGAASGLTSTLQSIGVSIAANFLPVLRTAAATFQTVVLPALTRLASYLSANLGPIFTQVGSIISGQVLPIVASLAQFFYGTLYPAVVSIVTAVASRLKPVFDAFFQTIQTSVLPTIQLLLAKFQEWMPTIQKVAGVILTVVGFLLKLAATILGVVLPPLIRIAGFIIGVLVRAFVGIIDVIGKVVGFVTSHWQALVAAIAGPINVIVAFIIRNWARIKTVIQVAVAVIKAVVTRVWNTIKSTTSSAFNAVKGVVTGVFNAIEHVIAVAVNTAKGIITRTWAIIRTVTQVAFAVVKSVISNALQSASGVVSSVVGKIKSTLSNAWNSAKELTSNAWEALKNAISDKINAALNLVQGLPGKITGALGSLASTLFNAGAELIQGLINGITSKISALTSKMNELADKVKGFLPGSPVKEGPLRSWNNGGAGKRLVGLLASGLEDTSPVDAAMARLSNRVVLGSPNFATSALATAGPNGGAAGVGGGGRVGLRITNWDEGVGYFESVADSRVAGDRALQDQRMRAL